MPTSTPEARVVGVTGNIVSVESDAPLMKNSIAFVHTGDASLKGEVLRVLGRRADLQIFEETQGVRVGDRVELTPQMLSATLGPGLLGMIYDGLQNPLEALAQRDGFFLVRGKAIARSTSPANGRLYPAASRASAYALATSLARWPSIASRTRS